MKRKWSSLWHKKHPELPGLEDLLPKLADATLVHILVLSDSHGRTDGIARILERYPCQPDLILHLDDHCGSLGEISVEFGCPVLGVAGNCDEETAQDLPAQRLLVLANYRIFMTHGHQYHVKYDLGNLVKTGLAMENNADIILFGHTHHYLCEQHSRAGQTAWVINPGSCHPAGGGPSAVLLTLADTHMNCRQLHAPSPTADFSDATTGQMPT